MANLKTIAPKSWNWESTLEVARKTAELISSGRREFSSDEYAHRRGIYDQRRRARAIAILQRAEKLAQQHDPEHPFSMISDALETHREREAADLACYLND